MSLGKIRDYEASRNKQLNLQPIKFNSKRLITNTKTTLNQDIGEKIMLCFLKIAS